MKKVLRSRRFNLGLFLPERLPDKQSRSHKDARVGHVESWPRVGKRDVQIKQEEIDDRTVENAVRQVAKNPGQQQRPAQAAAAIRKFPAPSQRSQHHQRHAGKGDKEGV